ncbi:MAG: hypothetical protein DCC73_14880 [Proteobacteria bacterium]|nr:MAG: hypothetical protein DCC73_14880 [Pseudomonadota bacterium]
MTVDCGNQRDPTDDSALAASGRALPRTPTDYAHEFMMLLSLCYAAQGARALREDALREITRLRQRFDPSWFDDDCYDPDDYDPTLDGYAVPDEIRDRDLISAALDRLGGMVGRGEFAAAVAEIDALIFVRDQRAIDLAYKLAQGMK